MFCFNETFVVRIKRVIQINQFKLSTIYPLRLAEIGRITQIAIFLLDGFDVCWTKIITFTVARTVIYR